MEISEVHTDIAISPLDPCYLKFVLHFDPINTLYGNYFHLIHHLSRSFGIEFQFVMSIVWEVFKKHFHLPMMLKVIPVLQNSGENRTSVWGSYYKCLKLLCVSYPCATDLTVILFLLFVRSSTNSPRSFQRLRRTLKRNFNWIRQQMKNFPIDIHCKNCPLSAML